MIDQSLAAPRRVSPKEARVEGLGGKDLFPSSDVTWINHEGDDYVTLQQWDGAKRKVVSDWIAPDWALLRPNIDTAAAN